MGFGPGLALGLGPEGQGVLVCPRRASRGARRCRGGRWRLENHLIPPEIDALGDEVSYVVELGDNDPDACGKLLCQECLEDHTYLRRRRGEQ